MPRRYRQAIAHVAMEMISCRHAYELIEARFAFISIADGVVKPTYASSAVHFKHAPVTNDILFRVAWATAVAAMYAAVLIDIYDAASKRSLATQAMRAMRPSAPAMKRHRRPKRHGQI